jgi:hypothetical protein
VPEVLQDAGRASKDRSGGRAADDAIQATKCPEAVPAAYVGHFRQPIPFQPRDWRRFEREIQILQASFQVRSGIAKIHADIPPDARAMNMADSFSE